MNRHDEHPSFRNIEKIRCHYLENNESIAVTDYGAGSRTSGKEIKKLKEIVKSSAVSARYGKMLHYLADYFRPEFIIELGTSAGISTSYLASANPLTKVFTIEGDSNIAQIAGKTFDELNIKNIEQITGTFENALQHVMMRISGRLLVFIDGNHQYNCVLDYFQRVKMHSGECLIIFDDIRWSDDMLKAWSKIRSDPSVKISMDLFFMGIVLLNANIQKQDFVIKY